MDGPVHPSGAWADPDGVRWGGHCRAQFQEPGPDCRWARAAQELSGELQESPERQQQGEQQRVACRLRAEQVAAGRVHLVPELVGATARQQAAAWRAREIGDAPAQAK
jgi:hypothetical protein